MILQSDENFYCHLSNVNFINIQIAASADKNVIENQTLLYRLGVVACSCNPATWKPELVDGLRTGVLLVEVLCRSGVRTKPGINMVTLGEPEVTRLSKEG